MGTISLERKDEILYIDFNSPPLNVLNLEIIGDIIDVLEKEKETKVLALKGSGKFFCTGVDVKEHLPEKVDEMLERFSDLAIKLFEFPGITCSIVQGGAFGGGCEVAFCSDILIAQRDASFSQPEIKLGVLPPVACALYPLLFSSKIANYLNFSGQNLTAEELEHKGIVNLTFEREKLFEEAHNYLKKFTKLSFPAIRYTKKASNLSLTLFKERLKEVNAIYLNELMKTEDAMEGLKAFLEKRKPLWKNR